MSKSSKYTETLYNKLIGFLSYSPRTQSELEQRADKYLSQKTISPEEKSEIKESVLKMVREIGLVDDYEYAKNYVAGRQRSGIPTSPMKMKSFLFGKGISGEIIEKVLESIESEYLAESLEKLIEKRLRSTKARDQRELKQKITSYLISKGYPVELVYSVVDTKIKLN